MEYGMNGVLDVCFTNLQVDILEKIEFIFKLENKNEAPAIKYVVWKNGIESDEVYTLDDDLTTFYIPFSKEETFNFVPGKKFYMDVRITYADIFSNPHVSTVPIVMGRGLFGRDDG